MINGRSYRRPAPRNVNEDAEQIRTNIEILSEFETAYRQFVQALEEGQRGRPYWHPQAFAQRKRDILETAPRANLAAKASGVQIAVEKFGPDGQKETVTNLENLVMDYHEGEHGMDVPHMLLDALPRQIGVLRIKLEKAESGNWNPPKADPAVSTYTPLSPGPDGRWQSWINHPWTITIVGGIVAAVIAGIIVALTVSA